jgi:hypothetical protein
MSSREAPSALPRCRDTEETQIKGGGREPHPALPRCRDTEETQINGGEREAHPALPRCRDTEETQTDREGHTGNLRNRGFSVMQVMQAFLKLLEFRIIGSARGDTERQGRTHREAPAALLR